MGKQTLPAKFANEVECIFCGCQYLPNENTAQGYCAQCVKNNYKIPDDGIVKQEQEVLYSKNKVIMDNRIGLSAFRPKKCCKCRNEFTPNAPANRICPNCKKK